MARTIKRGDTYPPLTGSISDANGAVALTTAASVTLILKKDATVKKFTITDVDTPGTGEWSYDIQVDDFDTVGTWNAEIEVVWSTGVIQTFPNTGTDTITVEQDLGDT